MSGSKDQDTSMSQLQDLIDNIDLWPVAVCSPTEFSKGGLYYEEVKCQFEDKFTDGIHFMLKGFPQKKFCYSGTRDSIELCLGLTHIPIRRLSAEEEKAASLVASAVPEEFTHNSNVASSFGSLSPSKESEKFPKAFTGKGHSLLASSDDDEGE